MGDLASLQESAIRLGVKVGTLRKWIREGRIQGVKLGKLTRL